MVLPRGLHTMGVHSMLAVTEMVSADSPEDLKQNSARQYRPRVKIQLSCEWCKKPFLATRPDARYDTIKCRVAAHRAGKEENGA